MIIIPELKTVLLQPPRTATTSVRDAVLTKYPKAFLLYRHMEYDGIPFGYRHWRVISQIRHPKERLLSVFAYMSDPIIKERTCRKWLARMRCATEDGFDVWLTNKEIFTHSHVPTHEDFRPRDCVMWDYPEQMKSQALWAKNADNMIFYEDLRSHAKRLLDVELDHKNASSDVDFVFDPQLLNNHLNEFHWWDMGVYLNAAIER